MRGFRVNARELRVLTHLKGVFSGIKYIKQGSSNCVEKH